MRAALHVELAADIEDVFFHRVDVEDEVTGDLAVGRAIYQQAQHLALTCREGVPQLIGAGGGAMGSPSHLSDF